MNYVPKDARTHRNEENRSTQRKPAQLEHATPQRKAPLPSCCEVTVVTTEPPCGVKVMLLPLKWKKSAGVYFRTHTTVEIICDIQ